MSTPATERARKRKLLRRVRRQRLKYITILPSLITLINGICGFAAIELASKGAQYSSFSSLRHPNFEWAGYMIFIAMIADMLDGRVARMSHTTSSFGGQLDSLCDVVSFGVAPAFLMLKLTIYKLDELLHPSPIIEPFIVKFIWISAALFMACAAIRLARFNVENEEDETHHMNFVGLPSPAAAGVLASLVVFYEYAQPLADGITWLSNAENAILFILPFVSIACALLMISRITYPHLINVYFRGRKPFEHLIWVAAIIFLIYWSVQTGLLLLFCGFAIGGFAHWAYKKTKAYRASVEAPQEPPVLAITHSAESNED